MSEKRASEGLPCDVKALALQLAHLGHPRPEDLVALAGGQEEVLEDLVALADEQKWFLEDPAALAGVQRGFLEDLVASAGAQGEVLAWVCRFPAFQALQSSVGFLFQDVLAVGQTHQEVSSQGWEEKDLAAFGKLRMVSSSWVADHSFVPQTYCSLVMQRRVSPETVQV